MLQLTRHWFTPVSTQGILAIDGVFQCYTLEPRERDDKPRCIPVGTYKVEMQPSHRFEKNKEVAPDGKMPFLLNVDGFVGIMIHPGNYPDDTQGCILPGRERKEDAVMGSRLAFAELREKVAWPTSIMIEESPPQDGEKKETD